MKRGLPRFKKGDKKMQDELLAAEDVAKFLKCKPGKIYELKAAGKIPYLKINGMLRFSRNDILNWLESQKHKAVN